MAWSGGKCTRVRSIAFTGPLLPERPGEGGRAGIVSGIFKKTAHPSDAVTRSEEKS